MLVLIPTVQRIDWPEAGMTLDLVPLPESKDQEFVKQTMIEVRGHQGELKRMERDSVKYAELVGNHCIKGWTGVVVDPDSDEEAPCTPENINRLMAIDVAQLFVFNQIKGLSLHIKSEDEEAKKDSPPE